MASEAPSAIFSPDWQATGRLITDISRADIARYAGSSGDLNLVHVDELFATQVAQQPSVIAHGMFVMALTGSFLTSLIGHEPVRRFGGRFLAPVFPGDSLDCTASVRSMTPEGTHTTLTLHLSTCRGDGSVVFRAEATVSLPTPA